jgi:predicted metalloendopeptidase
MPATAVNAYYDPSKNQIVFPAGVLQKTFFALSYPPSVNFGGIGAVIGHEMTHGFDDTGRRYDGGGHLAQWWEPATEAAFSARAARLGLFYSRLGQDGNRTMGENIADVVRERGGVDFFYILVSCFTFLWCANYKFTVWRNCLTTKGGLKIAYLAYKNASGTPPPLFVDQARPLTLDQLFFIAFVTDPTAPPLTPKAQDWCGIQTPRNEAVQLLSDVHSLARNRVFGSISNSDFFQGAFGCSANATMTSQPRVGVW